MEMSRNAPVFKDCEKQKKADEEERIKRWNEKVANAVAVDEKDVKTTLYCEETDQYYCDLDDFFVNWYSDHDKEDIKPQRLWVTAVIKISIDAEDVVRDACEELHENAYDYCDVSSLQELLNGWCEEQTGTTTYYPSYKQYVVIDWRAKE